jgi:hypothetical protein
LYFFHTTTTKMRNIDSLCAIQQNLHHSLPYPWRFRVPNDSHLRLGGRLMLSSCLPLHDSTSLRSCLHQFKGPRDAFTARGGLGGPRPTLSLKKNGVSTVATLVSPATVHSTIALEAWWLDTTWKTTPKAERHVPSRPSQVSHTTYLILESCFCWKFCSLVNHRQKFVFLPFTCSPMTPDRLVTQAQNLVYHLSLSFERQ